MDILQLPQELIIRISSYLTTPELGSLRLTCKHVETALYDSFALEFFTKRQFMVAHVSLQALVGIANHPTLSKKLSEVIISAHAFVNDFRPAGDHVNRDVLLDTGHARAMLTEAFSKLPNLRTVGLRDFHGSGRHRDGENSFWRSYGWSHANGLKNTRVDTMLPLILCSLGSARAEPQNLEVILRRHEKLGPTSCDVFFDFMIDLVVPVLAGLKRVLLTVSSNPQSYTPNDMEWESLRRFLHHLPNLEHLRLNFTPLHSHADIFLSWFSKPITCQTVPATAWLKPIALPKLHSLDLGMLDASPDNIIKTIRKFDPVSLSLWKIELNDPQTDGWAMFLEEFGRRLSPSTRLQEITIGFVSALSRRVWFSGTLPDGSVGKLDVLAFDGPTSGMGVREWLLDQATQVVDERPVLENAEGDDAEGEDEDGEDDDNDDDGDQAEESDEDEE